MLTWLLSLLGFVTAVLHIRAEYRGPRIQVYLFKPLATFIIILIALFAEESVAWRYQVLIVAGLLFSLAGDIFLMLPSDRFVAGLFSFLVAHLLYIAAFVGDSGVASGWWLIPFLVFAAAIYNALAPHLGKLKGPVILYIVVISVMAWQAAGRWFEITELGALLAFAGAVLFVISDSTLALNRFRRTFKSARLLTMATYSAAQWLIALSIGVV